MTVCYQKFNNLIGYKYPYVIIYPPPRNYHLCVISETFSQMYLIIWIYTNTKTPTNPDLYFKNPTLSLLPQ